MITVLSLSPAVDKIYYVDGFKPGNLYRVRETGNKSVNFNNVKQVLNSDTEKQLSDSSGYSFGGIVTKSAGGKGVNVARIASIIGERVCCIGFMAGNTGRWIKSQLEKHGVSTNFIEVSGETRTNINIVDRASNLETEILEEGPFIDAAALDKFVLEFESVLDKTKVLVCSGSLPVGMPDDFYGTLIKKAKERNVRVILDTSGKMLIEGMKSLPNIVKPNLRELQKYVGRSLLGINDVVKACREIISSGVKAVVPSMGREGALLVTEDMVLQAVLPPVNAVNSIGSGDALVAGLAAGVVRNYSPDDMLRLGIACALANVEHEQIGCVDKERAEKYFKQVKISVLQDL